MIMNKKWISGFLIGALVTLGLVFKPGLFSGFIPEVTISKVSNERHIGDRQHQHSSGPLAQTDLRQVQQRLSQIKFSDEAKQRVIEELSRLQGVDPRSSEAQEIKKYLGWLVGLPWDLTSSNNIDVDAAKQILDQDHYGIEKVKERILEFLAVRQRVGVSKAPVLCLVGPPGVGKTSLVKSIAKATSRKFVRIALGGVRDEAAIRGAGRVYVGSRPGKLIQAMKTAEASDPVILLDEIDKIQSGPAAHGDPAAALLEVLDPEQNTTFADHYLEVGYDLSKVMFIATANSLADLPRPLLDRMEIIHLSSYTEKEKFEIAKRYLVQQERKQCGLSKDEFSISDEALTMLIRQYTREAGVRNLGREIAKLCRKVTKQILAKTLCTVRITKDNLQQYAGPPVILEDKLESKNLVGVSTGLAWSQVGGSTMAIETVALPGTGKIISTGSLGKVMEESVRAALSYIRSQSDKFGISDEAFKNKDIHVHFPEGGVPKDGPSAGTATITSIVSALTNTPVHHDVAMTGEITLRGRVLPIGGLKEKLIAAHQHGIKKVLIPKDNEHDLKELDPEVRAGLQIIPIETVDQALAHALKQRVA